MSGILTDLLKDHVLQDSVHNAASDTVDQIHHNEPGLGLDDQNDDVLESTKIELNEAFEDLVAIESIHASLENILTTANTYSEEGFSEGILAVTKHHLQYLQKSCGIEDRGISESNDVVSLESSVGGFLEKVAQVARDVFKKIVEILKKFGKELLKRFKSLKPRAERLKKRAEFLKKRWIDGAEVEINDVTGSLLLNNKAVTSVKPLKDFGEFVFTVGNATSTWSKHARENSGIFLNSIKSRETFIFNTIDDKYFPLPAAELFPRLKKVHGDTETKFHTPVFVGEHSYIFTDEKFDAGSSAVISGAIGELTTLRFSGQSVVSDQTTVTLPIISTEDCSKLEGLVGNFEQAFDKIEKFVEDCEKIHELYESLYRDSEQKLMIPTFNKPHKNNIVVTSVLRSYGISGLSLARANQTLVHDLYRVAMAHLRWAEKSCDLIDPQAASTQQIPQLSHA